MFVHPLPRHPPTADVDHKLTLSPCPQHGQPKKRIPCGETHLDKATVLEYVDAVRDSWTAEAYHLLEYNCNSFTDTLLGFLNGNSIPADIRNQPSGPSPSPLGSPFPSLLAHQH